MYISLHVKCPLFLSNFINVDISRQMFEKSSNIKFHENPSSGSRVVPCGRKDTHDEANRFSQFCEKRLKMSAVQHVYELGCCARYRQQETLYNDKLHAVLPWEKFCPDMFKPRGKVCPRDVLKSILQ